MAKNLDIERHAHIDTHTETHFVLFFCENAQTRLNSILKQFKIHPLGGILCQSICQFLLCIVLQHPDRYLYCGHHINHPAFTWNNRLPKTIGTDAVAYLEFGSWDGVFNLLSSRANLHLSYNRGGRSHCRLQNHHGYIKHHRGMGGSPGDVGEVPMT